MKLPRLSSAVAVNLLILSFSSIISAQFLFTYEINPESESERQPKSSLFDPASFKIVTPSQLQSSYQKLSQAQPPSLPVSTLATNELTANEPTPTQPTARNDDQQQPSSFLKQTSAALQSFAELFSLTQSPPPAQNQQAQQLSESTPVNQEAEARSLHEHWTQQQQEARNQDQPSVATSALNSFTTSQPQPQSELAVAQEQGQQHNAQPSQASYWLTANPLNPPDGNYLVQIKSRPTNQEQAAPAPTAAQHMQQQQASLVDNLLAVGQQRPPRSHQSQSLPHINKPVTSASTSNLAQASFLSTPTSYYPAQAPQESSSLSPQMQHHFTDFSSPISIQAPKQFQANSFASPSPIVDNSQLQPPANIPSNFQQAAAPLLKANLLHQQAPHHHKSAEETLISFRQQQQDQQNAAFANQPPPSARFQQQQMQAPQPIGHQPSPSVNQPHAATSEQQHLGEIPKVSPQIYESFLLQQRDQHEKHMELLKQQQELNRLMEQKQRQQEAEQKKMLKRKKQEELEAKEAARRKQMLKEQEEAKRLKLQQEQQEAETRRKREQQLQQQQREKEQRELEEKRYREYLELREREKREQELIKQRREAEEAEKLRRQKELRLREEAENRKREKELEEAKYMQNLLRQQEELRKLLELKQKEDELQQQRRKQASLSSQQQQQPAQQQAGRQQPQQVPFSQASRARSLAQEHRERIGGATWGAPIRSRAVGVSFQQAMNSEPASTSSTTTAIAMQTTSTTSAPVEQPHSRHLNRIRAVKKQRHQQSSAATADNEKLIRQKIPLYTGPGQYGLYRGNVNANGSHSMASDLAALLDSVTLPSSTTSTTTPAPSSTMASTRQQFLDNLVTPGSFPDTSSSLSPLLDRSNSANLLAATDHKPLVNSATSSNEPFFDDDVPRRPARGLAQSVQASSRLRPAQAQPQQAPITTASSSLSSRRLESAASLAAPHQTSANSSSASKSHALIGLASLPPDSDNDGIPGRAGIEYPVLAQVPTTSFSCSKQPLNGYYADTETACQVVHLCQGGVQSSILCPNGTIFNQEKFSCQWWYEVNCSRAPIFYQLNDNLYKLNANGTPAKEPLSERDANSEKLKSSSSKAAASMVLTRQNSANNSHSSAKSNANLLSASASS